MLKGHLKSGLFSFIFQEEVNPQSGPQLGMSKPG